MKNNTGKPHSLSRRIVTQFCIFTLFLSTFYGCFCFIFLYILEDNFIEREVGQEADYLIAHYQKTDQWPAPRSSHMSLHFSKSDLPDDLNQQLTDEPQRNEFYGFDGRHYHLLNLSKHDSVYLVAEVSQKLLVRPIRSGIVAFFLVCTGILTLVAFFIAWMLGRKTATPLKRLADLVDGVAPENIPSTFAHNFPNNEIGVLARTLENSMQQISKALEREKCFTRDTSHELRTPVAIVKNAVEVYHSKNTDNDDNQQLISRISDAAMQMEQTVNTLLMLAREEHNSDEKTQVQLLPLVEQSILDHSYILNDKAVEVDVSNNCNTQVHALSGMLKVLLDNLLSNAFQYTNLGEVKVDFIDNQLIISDTGPGIEEGISSLVTAPAVKGSQSTGYGFGLSIVKRLCEHQGWQLTVESNKGTVVSVLFSVK
ncbi:sensor histidine kinase [Cognaticolwellia mytili]|uniref:sensor histidine kinase n=1 Tax=Cognaticolwellia mytili TaxID=1888913 RepID=UPI000A174A8D|nr:HAMP domain-containing sensor histidine kinase [Cognaticolwellia mytili]